MRADLPIALYGLIACRARAVKFRTTMGAEGEIFLEDLGAAGTGDLVSHTHGCGKLIRSDDEIDEKTQDVTDEYEECPEKTVHTPAFRILVNPEYRHDP